MMQDDDELSLSDHCGSPGGVLNINQMVLDQHKTHTHINNLLNHSNVAATLHNGHHLDINQHLGNNQHINTNNENDSNNNNNNNNQNSSQNNGNSKKRSKTEARLKPDKDGCPSYTAMIAEAIMRTAFKRATLAEIYDFMNTSFEQLTKRGSGWRNCVRHTLSLNDCFLKLHRPENGRSCNWTIHPSYLEAFLKGDYRKQRKNRRKVKNVPWLEKDALHYSTTLPPYLNEQDMSLRHTDHGRLVGLSQWQNYGSLNTPAAPTTTGKAPGSTLEPPSIPSTYVMESMYRDMKLKPPKPPSPTLPTTLQDTSQKNITPPPDTDTDPPNNLTCEQSLTPSPFPCLSTNSFKFSSPVKEEHLNRYSTSHLTATMPSMKYDHHLSYPTAAGTLPGYHHVNPCPSGYEVDLPYATFAARSYKQEFY